MQLTLFWPISLRSICLPSLSKWFHSLNSSYQNFVFFKSNYKCYQLLLKTEISRHFWVFKDLLPIWCCWRSLLLVLGVPHTCTGISIHTLPVVLLLMMMMMMVIMQLFGQWITWCTNCQTVITEYLGGRVKKGVIIVFPVFPSPAYKETGEVVIWFILTIVF